MKELEQNLVKNSICEMRSFTNPPKAVRLVVEAMCVILKEKPSWQSFMRIAVPPFPKSLKSIDINNFTRESFDKLDEYIKMPEFNVKLIQLVSLGAQIIFKW